MAVVAASLLEASLLKFSLLIQLAPGINLPLPCSTSLSISSSFHFPVCAISHVRKDLVDHHFTSIKMTILVTGSLGKTSSRLAATLKSGGHSFLVASRSGKAGSYPAVRFDWTDKSTWDLPFNSPEAQKDPITAAYLVSPPVKEPFQYEQAFIDFARTKGVKRFVFLGASPMDENNPYANVHRYLKRLGTEEGLEWAVLRPTWFMRMLCLLHACCTCADSTDM